MILADLAAADPSADRSGISIDEIFRSAARRRPERLAVADAPNRETFTDGASRRLSYAQADRAIEAIAARLRHMGLPANSIVGIQLPNIVENILTLLGIMRAGMIAAPLPLLWRRADTVAALARIGAKALITCRRVGNFNHCHAALRAAVEVFSIRYVCGFGANLPDGVVSFEDLVATQDTAPVLVDREPRSNSAGHIAVVSFDIGAGGILPVARTHVELLAGGLAVLLESRLAQDSVMLSTLAPSSFAGISLTLVPWLLSGGTLLLHHPFNSNILGRQWRDDRFGVLILPPPIAFRLAGSGAFAREGPTCIIAPWRSPDLLSASPPWRQTQTDFVDVSIFGEAGLVAGRRSHEGGPAPIPLGPVVAPRHATDAERVVVAELARTAAGTVALRGPMVPHHAFPPGLGRIGLPHLAIAPHGVVDSGYPCRIDATAGTITVTAPLPDIASVGGYRFPLHDLQDVVGRIEAGAGLTAVPDLLLGQRLAGTATDDATVAAALLAVGVNPLIIAAFRGSAGSSDVGSVPAGALPPVMSEKKAQAGTTTASGN